MEGLTKGWYRTSHLNGRWHYYDGNGSHSACTLVFSDKQKDYLEKFEIAEGTICRSCEVLVDSEKILIKAQDVIGKILVNRICSDSECIVSGVAYVPCYTKDEKPHYYTKHNLRLQQNNSK